MENIDIDKPERIIRRHGKPSKKNNKLGFYLYIGAGIIILIALLTAIWLILKEPEIPSTVIDPSRASSLVDSERGVETNLSTPSTTEGASGTIPLNFDNMTTENSPNSSPEASSTLSTQVTTNQTSMSNQPITDSTVPMTIPDAITSNLPLDYALAAKKMITATPSAVVSRTITNDQLGTTPIDTTTPSAVVENHPEVSTKVDPSTPQPNVNTIQTANDVQAQLNSAAVQVSPQAQYKETPINQTASQVKPEVAPPKIVNQTVNTQPIDAGVTKNVPVKTQVPTLANETQPQNTSQSAVTPPSSNNKSTSVTSPVVTDLNTQPVPTAPQTAVINNSKIGNQSLPRPTPPDTIKHSAAVNPNQESAVKIQVKQKEQKPVVKAEKPKPAKTPKSSEPVRNIAKATTPSSPATRARINHGNGGKYSIQIASAAKPDGLRKLAVSRDLTSARVIEMERNGAKWYVLVNGRYATRQEAQKAISTLPADMQKNKPWVREVP